MARISASDLQRAIILAGSEDFADTAGYRNLRAVIDSGMGSHAGNGPAPVMRTLVAHIKDVATPKRGKLLEQFERMAGDILIGIRPESAAARQDALDGKSDRVSYVFDKLKIVEEFRYFMGFGLTPEFRKALQKTTDIKIEHAPKAPPDAFEYTITFV